MSYNARTVYQQNSVASQYDSKRFSSWKGQLTYRLENALIFRALARAGVVPPARILDVPCGTGRLSLPMSQQGYQVTGVDLSQAMLNQTLAKAKGFPQLNLLPGDAENLPFPDGSFDLAVSLRFFGHVPPEVRQRVLGELKRVSRGPLIVAYYLRHCLQRYQRDLFPKTVGTMWFPVTHKQIKEELASQGLQQVACWHLVPLLSETLVVLASVMAP